MTARGSLKQLEEPENRLPECLYLSIDGKSKAKSQLSLRVTLVFDEQWIPLWGGRIKVGLSGGDLRLRLNELKMPFSSRRFIFELGEKVSVKRTHALGTKESGSQESTTSAGLGLGARDGGHASIDASNKQSKYSERGANTETAFEFEIPQIRAKGPDDCPIWSFEVATGEPVLRGALVNEDLGRLDIGTPPSSIVATFEAAAKDIRVTASEGIWPDDVHVNKQIVIRVLISRLYLRKKIGPFISRCTMVYE